MTRLSMACTGSHDPSARAYTAGVQACPKVALKTPISAALA